MSVYQYKVKTLTWDIIGYVFFIYYHICPYIIINLIFAILSLTAPYIHIHSILLEDTTENMHEYTVQSAFVEVP